MEETLWTAIKRLAPLAPEFVSVTYGAGGSTRERTHATVERIIHETALRPAAHLTCVDATCEEVDEVARAYWDGRRAPHRGAARRSGRRRRREIRAARPAATPMPPTSSQGLKKIANFEISVAGYPEKHPESPSVAGRHRQPEGQGRRRRRPHHHPVRLRQRRTTCAFSSARAPPASGCRSRPASCRSTTSTRSRASPSGPAPACRPGSRAASRGSTTTPRRPISWPPPSPPSRCMDLVDEGVQHVPLLHAEPRRSRLRDLPPAGAAAAQGGAARAAQGGS